MTKTKKKNKEKLKKNKESSKKSKEQNTKNKKKSKKNKKSKNLKQNKNMKQNNTKSSKKHKESRKTISFVVPCYNSAEYMDNCIEHLLELNNKSDDIEIIIVDDGSQKDSTLKIAKNWEKKYPNVVRAIHQENGGHGEAVNTGLKAAKGLYFKVVDSDDWLDVKNMQPVMKYLRAQFQESKTGKITTDLVIANYVYNKVHENAQTPINYADVFPENTVFTWADTKKFGPSQYILMHSVFYRTQLLKNIGLVLPKHTFYVDNIFVYNPLPYVKTMYYINADVYMYYIGREDQSVNEDIMKSRIDQQLLITKIMIDSTNYSKISKNKKLSRYMISYLSMMMGICSIFLRMIGTDQAEKKRQDLWKHLKNTDKDLYNKLKHSLIAGGTNLPGKPGKGIAIAGYKFAQKVYKFN